MGTFCSLFKLKHKISLGSYLGSPLCIGFCPLLLTQGLCSRLCFPPPSCISIFFFPGTSPPSVFRNSSDPTSPFLCRPLHQNRTEALSVFSVSLPLAPTPTELFPRVAQKIVSLSLFFFFLNLQIMHFISSWVHWWVVVQEMCLLHWSWQMRWHKIVYIILFFLMYLGSIVLPLFLYSISNFCYLYFCWIVYIEVNHIYLSFWKNKYGLLFHEFFSYSLSNL